MSSTAATTTPRPLHHLRPLRRLALLFLVATLLLALLWLTWRSRTARRLAAARAAFPSPITLADLRTPPVDPADNAPDLYLRAAKAITLSAPEQNVVDTINPAAPTPADLSVLAPVIARNSTALADLRAARALPTRSWRINVVSPVYNTLLPHLNGTRASVNFLCAAAIHARATGDHAAALARLHDAFALADSLDASPFLVSHLVANGIRSKAGATLADLLPVIDFTSPPTRAAANDLLKAILDERTQTATLARSLTFERLAADETITTLFSRATIVAPLADDQQARTANHYAALARAAAAPTYPAARALLPPPPPKRLGPAVIADVPFAMVIPALNRYVDVDFRARGDRRLRATALAIRLYQSDHAGALPPTLDALVPAYLPAVPTDPFALTATAPLRYLPAASQPAIYSVGLDAADNRAATQPADPRQAPNPWAAPDAVLPLTPAK